MLNKDKLISAERLKQSIAMEIGDKTPFTEMISRAFLELIDEQPEVDPKFSGQWIRYDGLNEIMEALAGEEADKGNQEAERTILEVAEYFQSISKSIKAAGGGE